MKFTENFPKTDEPMRKFVENVTLSIVEYILQEGIDSMLEQCVGITKEQCRIFPNLAKAMKEKGLL